NNLLPHPPEAWKNIFNTVVLGLSAGLFEELSRYAMFRWWLKDVRSWRKGVLTGAGHGGAEAIILGVLVLLGYLNLVLLQNPAILATVPAGQLEMVKTQMAAYWSTPWYATMLGAFERLCTIPVQICFAVIVLQTFTRKQWFWVWLAVLYHAVIDASAVFLLPLVGMYWLEAIVAGFSLLSLLIIFKLRQPEPIAPEPVPVVSAPQVILNPVEETPENLDASRYQ
ncbi:MAG: YhfC family glutamic-type intramembrane protease, partial [Anaerolineales bacterium]